MRIPVSKVFGRLGCGACAAAVGVAALWTGVAAASPTNQDHLKPVVNQGERVLNFDWPMIKVGTAEYTEGPTGTTVIHFDKKVLVAIDSRGGGPGTVNAHYMDIGYDLAELDTVVFSGGSWYGLEAVTAVASALKDDGLRDGGAFAEIPTIAMSVGAIIFDFGSRRLNEIYPDKKLAQAAFRAAKPGWFPLGAEGAGRFTKTGGVFGCNAFSGQGAAYREFGKLKVAAFVVVNSSGVLTKRDGTLAACYEGEGWPENVTGAELMANFPDSKLDEWDRGDGNGPSRKNTTISLIVVNQKMTPAMLKRLAVQVHTSIARAIHPYATYFDGDVLYAVSTGELDEPMEAPFAAPRSTVGVGVSASEVMWDALLSSVPEQPKVIPPSKDVQIANDELKSYEGDYWFSDTAALRIKAGDNKLSAKAIGTRPVYSINANEWTDILPADGGVFTVPERYPFVFAFGEPGKVTINPGHWAQHGERRD